MANLSAIKLPNGTTYDLKDNGALQLTGGQVTGPVTFGDSVSIDDLTVGQLVVNGSTSFTNNIQANTINGIEIGASPKFTDTVTTVTTSGSGNAVTAVTASNGALTITKGTTFLTSYTETDPVFSASAAAGISATDISNWNDKVPIDNGNMLVNNDGNGNGFIVEYDEVSLIKASGNPTNQVSIHYVVTPTADTDAANKKYVDDSIPKVYSSTNTGGYLTMATLPIYDGTVE